MRRAALPTAFVIAPALAVGLGIGLLVGPDGRGEAGQDAAEASSSLYMPFALGAGEPARIPSTQTLDLDGTWQLAHATSLELVPADGWTAVQVPSFVTWDPDRPHLWFRRTFAAPGGFAGEWAFLRFGGVKFAARVYLNGTLLGRHDDGFTPFELAVPPEVLLPQNELVVQVDGWRSAIAPEMTDQEGTRAEDVADALLYPVGSQEWDLGIWQSVSLTVGRGVRLTDAFVRTSVRAKTVRLEVTLQNPTSERASVRLDNEVLDGDRPAPDADRAVLDADRAVLDADRVVLDSDRPVLDADRPVLDADRPVLAFEPLTVDLAAGEVRTVQLRHAWPSPRLWSPDDPHLYRLLTILDTGDVRETRFGFRELWVEGNQVILNGTPIHLRGTAAHPFVSGGEDIQSIQTARRTMQKAKDGHNVIMRLHAQPWPSVWYEAADEVGLLVVWESAYWCNSTNYLLEDPRFWANFREHLAGQIRRHRNHPSVVIWSLENELLLCSGQEQGATPRMRTAEAELAGLVDDVRSLDPDRPVMFDGDADPGGRADIVNLHYPHEYPGWHAWPNEAWWLEQTTTTDIYPGRIDGWPLAKPLYVGEFAWVPPYQIEGASIFFGDALYRDPAGYYRRGKAAAWEHQIEAYRCLGVQGFCPWNIWEGGDELPNPALFDLVQRRYEPNALFTRERSNRFFVGSPITRTAYLFNDRLAPAELTAEWALRVGGPVLARQSRDFNLRPAEIASFELALPAPGADRVPGDPSGAPVLGTLSWDVTEAGEPVFSSGEPVWLYERQALRASGPLALYDPVGATAATLLREGLSVERVPDLTDLPPGAGALIVGADGLATVDDWQRLVSYADRGGRVLLLRQTEYPAGVPLHLASGAATIAFPRQADHSALGGLTADDLRYWAPDHVVIRTPLVKPDFGTYRVLVDAGSAAGLQYVGLLEQAVGQGTILCVQLDLVTRLDREPAARRLFQNLLAYLADFQPAGATAFGVVGATATEEQALRAIGFDVQTLHEGVPAAGLILAGGDSAAAAIPGLLAEVERGATLWLHEPGAEALQALGDAGLPVAGRAAVRGLVTLGADLRDAGLTDYSLFWAEGRVERAGAMPPLAHSFAATVFSPPVDWTGAVEVPHNALVVRSGAAHVGADRVVLYADGALEAELTVAAAADYELGVEAEGTPVEGEYPLVRLAVDGETLAILAIGERAVYAAPGTLAAGRHVVRLEFFNDRWEPPEDRNLTVFRLLVAPSAAAGGWQALTQPAAMVQTSHGAGRVIVDALHWDRPGAGVRKHELLVGLLVHWGVRLAPPPFAWVLEAEEMEVVSGSQVVPHAPGVWFAANGTIAGRVQLPVSGRHTVRVLAAGTPLGGVYPEFEVASDGEVLGRQSVDSESGAYYEITADLVAGEHTLSLSFVNDAWAPPEDRNLFVDRITVLRR